jgi:predicted membrane channel-forming protein YqfA (hemolysin III family)
MSYKSRRRWALIILLVGMPLYIVLAVTVLNWMDRPALWVEVLVYVALGVMWAIPFRSVFRGIGQADPAAQVKDGQGDD